ncbi:hypothetical protein L195_g005735 [Trifolium pratense]|uniref:Uncharacterized protein n=2 Tax=Trifolium pratense TaxID=57577 RepID=A0ACB0IU67_TRIPR|nr:hypothetical protein L195_g005735 [Trifolium pratense]CAJ2635854.1 unnamed protein product [Trifolium pratense]
MEKLSQMKNKFFKFLPKRPVASVSSYQNPTLSPNTSVTTSRKVSIIPKEARRKHRSISFSAREPTSPKVSCMGQVKCKKKRKVKRVDQSSTKKSDSVTSHENKKVLFWDFKGSCESPTQSVKAFVLEENEVVAPSLGSMKKFVSGRGSLSDFDANLAER